MTVDPALNYASVLVYLAIGFVAGLSTYYSYRMNELAPADMKGSVRLFFAGVATLGLASVSMAFMLFEQGFGLGSGEAGHAGALIFAVASMSFFLALSFDIREGKM